MFLRDGMWIKVGSSVAIYRIALTADKGPVEEIHYVDAEGLTTSVQAMTGAEKSRTKQAGLLDIPEPRRPDPEFAAALGYI